jgi:ribbon-helix-helix CopG family protein
LTGKHWYGNEYGMPALKSTFSLDESSIAKLQRLSRKWQVSKTEVLRRALRQAAEREEAPEVKIAALRALRSELHAKGVDFAAWRKTIRAGRR